MAAVAADAEASPSEGQLESIEEMDTRRHRLFKASAHFPRSQRDLEVNGTYLRSGRDFKPLFRLRSRIKTSRVSVCVPTAATKRHANDIQPSPPVADG